MHTSLEEPLRKLRNEIFVADVFAPVCYCSDRAGSLSPYRVMHTAAKPHGYFVILAMRLSQVLRPSRVSTPILKAFLPLPVGDYTFTIYDSFGDGICCGFGEGWFSINTCVLDTTVYDFNTSEQTVPLLRSCLPASPNLWVYAAGWGPIQLPPLGQRS